MFLKTCIPELPGNAPTLSILTAQKIPTAREDMKNHQKLSPINPCDHWASLIWAEMGALGDSDAHVTWEVFFLLLLCLGPFGQL